VSTIKSSDEHLTLNADGSSKDIKFQANGVEKASISSAGAFTSTTIDATKLTSQLPSGIGIGVTPVSDNTLMQSVELGAGSAITGYKTSGSPNTYLTNNVKFNSSAASLYKATDEASRIVMDSAGTLSFEVAPSGSADAAISWTTAMTMYQAQSGAAADISMGARWSGDGGGKTDFQTNTNGGILMRMSSVNTGGNQRVWFVNPNGLVGNITTSGSGTSFNTSSDYRLKENVDYDWDATTRLKQLKPARFNFIADSDTIVDGFLAHEAAEVVPEAVSGVKDAMMDKDVYDKDGNVTGTESVINPQSIDQAKLVPLLVKTIQELEARITALEA